MGNDVTLSNWLYIVQITPSLANIHGGQKNKKKSIFYSFSSHFVLGHSDLAPYPWIHEAHGRGQTEGNNMLFSGYSLTVATPHLFGGMWISE